MKKIDDSFLAFSMLSEAWMTLAVIDTERSPRIVPGSAVRGFVAPTKRRMVVTASGPSSIISTTGPDVMWSTSS